MPITSSRLVTIINAGRDYQNAYGTLVAHIRSVRNQPPQKALASILSLIDSGLLLQPEQSNYVLERENRWFSDRIDYNRAERERMRIKRGGLHGKPHPEPPRLLLPDPTDPGVPKQQELDLQQQIAQLAMKVYELEHGKLPFTESKPPTEPGEPDPHHDPDDADEELGDSISRGDF